MKNGEHPDGAHVLRARIDTEHGPMAHPNMKLRDPLMYRIRRDAEHYRRGTEWAIYPLYDWAHGQGDAIEGVTHSVCTLEFDVNRPLYDWYLDAIGVPEPRNHQYEFARFNLDYTVMSKRKLRQLVDGGHVSGWDDPRMPTIAGLRRRGVRPQALRRFFADLGVTKTNGSVEIQQLEYALRDDLNGTARRVLAVTDPVRLEVAGLEAGTIDAPYWPHDVTAARRRAGLEAAADQRLALDRARRLRRDAAQGLEAAGARRRRPPAPRPRPRGHRAPTSSRARPSSAPASRRTRRRGASSTGSTPRPGCPRRSGSTTGCSPSPTRARARTSSRS